MKRVIKKQRPAKEDAKIIKIGNVLLCSQDFNFAVAGGEGWQTFTFSH